MKQIRKNDTEVIEIFSMALDIGKNILVSGGEMNRVEDTIKRILDSYGFVSAQICATTDIIMVTAQYKGEYLTQCRRVGNFSYNLEEMEAWNDVSRYICKEKPDASSFREKIDEIYGTNRSLHLQLAISYLLISFAFAMFFGGSIAEAIFSGVIGSLIYILERPVYRIWDNRFLRVCYSAIVSGLLAGLVHKVFTDCRPEYICIGNIMVFIPGLMITNSFREMFSNNIQSGSIRFVEAILVSLVVAIGIAGILFFI